MERPIVTVIIPVYNVEEYLEHAVDSICSQTLTDWELYLVDDGSKDGSGELCDRIIEDDSRIHVIHQENRGAAMARNAAIEKAKGKYLFFMDADDIAEPEMLFRLVCLAEYYYLDAWAGAPVNNAGRNLDSLGRQLKNPSDLIADEPEERCAQMVISGFYIRTYYSDSGYYIQKQAVPSRVFASKSEFRDHAHELFDRNLLYTPWNKLYLASYIKENNIRFPETHWDDFPFNLDVIRNIERVTVTDEAFYHFIRKRRDSESEKYNIALYSKREEENQWLIDLYDGWRKEQQELLLEEMRKDQPAIALDPDHKEQEDIKKDGTCDAADTLESENSEEHTEPVKDKDQEKEISGEDVINDDMPLPVVNIPSPEASEFIARRYIERIIGCIENVTSPDSFFTKREKYKKIREIITSESVRKALKVARPRSVHMKALLVPVRLKMTGLAYLEGAVISKTRIKHTRLFARLKDRR